MPAESTDDEASRRRGEAAERYRPDRVRLLLVAHAPPERVERYFYFERVTEKDDLFRYVVKGLFGRFPERADKAAWLGRLRDAGVFLIDLLERPYDGSDLALHVPSLVERVRQLGPEHVVLIKADVFDAAHGALRRAGVPVVDVRIPFPGSGQQLRFEAAFATAVQTIGWSTSATTQHDDEPSASGKRDASTHFPDGLGR
jgi:hypothetical protein